MDMTARIWRSLGGGTCYAGVNHESPARTTQLAGRQSSRRRGRPECMALRRHALDLYVMLNVSPTSTVPPLVRIGQSAASLTASSRLLALMIV